MARIGASLLGLVRTVIGGIVLTLAIIGFVESVSVRYFPIPQPSALYMIAVAAAALIGGLRSGLISALIVVAFSAYIVHDPKYPPFHYSGEFTARLVLFTIGAPLMAVIVGLLRRRNDDLLREHMLRAHGEETAKAERDREHRIVVTLQNAILSPITDNQFPGLDIGLRYEAAWAEAEIGGDFYDAFALDARTVAVVLGDISGKGLAAAAKTAEIKYTLRALLYEILRQDGETLKGISGAALGRVNAFLLRNETLSSHPIIEGSFEIPTFACLMLTIIRTDTGEMDLAVAAMEPPIVVHRDDCGKLGYATEVLEAGGLPLGVDPNATYLSTAQSLSPGDTLVFATDGITESRRSDSQDMLGIAGLQLAAETALAIASSKTEPLTTTAERIVASAKAFSGRDVLNDDACVILVRRQGESD